jgi:hypothetical protein
MFVMQALCHAKAIEAEEQRQDGVLVARDLLEVERGSGGRYCAGFEAM